MKIAPENLLHKSLKIKFLLLLLLILALVATGVSVVLINYQNNRQKQQISDQATAFSKLSVRPLGNAYDTYYSSGYFKFRQLTDETLSLDQNITRIQIIDVNGFLLFDSETEQQTMDQSKKVDNGLLKAISSDQATTIKNSQGFTTEVIEPYFDDFGARPFSIRYFISYDFLTTNLIRTIPLAFGVSFLIAVISGLIIVFAVNRTIITPIETIAQGAEAVSHGNLTARTNIETGDELQKLSLAVNNMASSLQKNIESLKELDRLKDEFIIIASHNLRTPITILKGYVSQLIADKKIKPTYKNTYKAMTVSLANLEGLIEELISIVSLETEKKIAAQTKVELNSILNQSITYNKEQAQDKKVTINLVSQEKYCEIRGDVTKLKVAFNNLIENSIKFNRENGLVTINIEAKDKDYLISFKDTGIGIAKAEIPLVFKKFHRATEILEYNYEGLGLGLYLTRVIIEAHQGKIWFESEAGLGSTFFVSLPKYSLKGGDA